MPLEKTPSIAIAILGKRKKEAMAGRDKTGQALIKEYWSAQKQGDADAGYEALRALIQHCTGGADEEEGYES